MAWVRCRLVRHISNFASGTRCAERDSHRNPSPKSRCYPSAVFRALKGYAFAASGTVSISHVCLWVHALNWIAPAWLLSNFQHLLILFRPSVKTAMNTAAWASYIKSTHRSCAFTIVLAPSPQLFPRLPSNVGGSGRYGLGGSKVALMGWRDFRCPAGWPHLNFWPEGRTAAAVRSASSLLPLLCISHIEEVIWDGIRMLWTCLCIFSLEIFTRMSMNWTSPLLLYSDCSSAHLPQLMFVHVISIFCYLLFDWYPPTLSKLRTSLDGPTLYQGTSTVEYIAWAQHSHMDNSLVPDAPPSTS